MKPTPKWYELVAHFAGDIEMIHGTETDYVFVDQKNTLIELLHSLEFFLRRQVKDLEAYELPLPVNWEWQDKEVYEIVVSDDLSIFLTLKLIS